MKQEKLELIADFYEFTMSNGYFVKNKNEIAYFDIFFTNIIDIVAFQYVFFIYIPYLF